MSHNLDVHSGGFAVIVTDEPIPHNTKVRSGGVLIYVRTTAEAAEVIAALGVPMLEGSVVPDDLATVHDLPAAIRRHNSVAAHYRAIGR